jgi:hypothetical protein
VYALTKTIGPISYSGWVVSDGETCHLEFSRQPCAALPPG